MTESDSQRTDWLSHILAKTMQGPLPLLLLLVAFVGGIVALTITAREEEPQIVVPMADVLVAAPGFSAEQVERQIATPLEKILYQIDGVEHVYSLSRSDQCVVTGGRPRQIRVELDPEALAARRTAPLEVAWAFDISNKLLPAGDQILISAR